MPRKGLTAGVAVLACVLGGGACRRGGDATVRAAAPRPDARADRPTSVSTARHDAGGGDGSTTETAGEDEDAAAAAARLNGLICKRPRCCVTRVMPAGTGADGTRYTVVRVDLMPGRGRCPAPQTGDTPDVVDPAARAREDNGELDDKQRARYRWDLVEETGGKVRWRQPLEIDRWARDDFGMGGGEDEVGADPATRTIYYRAENGSAWRGRTSVTIGLDPWRVVAFSSHSWFSAHTDESIVEWSWDDFSGRHSESTEFCRTGPSPDAGLPPEAMGGDTNDVDTPVAAIDDVIIPRLALPAGFVKTGWSTTSFREPPLPGSSHRFRRRLIPLDKAARGLTLAFQREEAMAASRHTSIVNFDHIGGSVRDLKAARTFYGAALGAIGMKINMDVGTAFGMGSRTQKIFWLGRDPKASGSAHYAFRVDHRDEVDAFYEAAMSAGGKDNGKPGPRPNYGPNYYAAFVKDPEDNNIEVVCYARGATPKRKARRARPTSSRRRP